MPSCRLHVFVAFFMWDTFVDFWLLSKREVMMQVCLASWKLRLPSFEFDRFAHAGNSEATVLLFKIHKLSDRLVAHVCGTN